MTLPLKGQMALRSLWEDKEASVHKAREGLKDVLGRDVSCQPEFPILFAELENVYDEKGDVIKAIVSCIQVWYQALTDLVDDEKNEDWGYNMLAIFDHQKAWHLELVVEVGKSTVATTLWSESQKAFVLTLPNTKVVDATAFAESFRDDLYEEFETPLDADESTKSATADAAAADAEWTDVTEEPAKKTPIAQPTTTRDAGSAALAAQAPHVETELVYLPKAQELARPNDLFSKPPYRITVHARSSAVDILSNHSPSLELLEAYMTRWCRSDYNYTNKPPIVDLKLHNSPWGLGPMYDRLSMTIPKNSYQVEYISPLMPISMIEGVLGFKETYSDGSTWHFLRTVPYKE